MARNLPEEIQEEAHTEAPVRCKQEINTDNLIPSGSTLLNLACSDTPYGAYQLGGIVTIPGASGSGKTILSLTTLAEVSKLARFDDYDLIHDDAEERRAFDLSYLFGESVAERIKAPALGNSPTIQTFQANCLNLLKADKPFIYVLDSFDSLSSDEELEKEMRKALAAAKSAEAASKIAGSYGTEKAKIAGQVLRMINNGLKKSKSLLIILQQRRQKMDSGPFGDKWTTAGGEAPFFYSNHQVWIAKSTGIKKKEQIVGTEAVLKLKKNSLTGKLRDHIKFNIYYDYGIDDIVSCIDFLVEENWWKKKGNQIDATDLDLCCMKGKLVEEIEEKNLERKLIRTTHQCWREREESLKLGRKPRY